MLMKARATSQSAALDAASFKQAIDAELTRLFSDAIATAQTIDPAYAQLLIVTRDTLLAGGKRLRPYISHLAYTGLGGTDPRAFTPIAASQELLHHFLLIHDDIIDRDLTRHGGPNVQGNYLEHFTKQGLSAADAMHYAESFALMAGNAACALGLQAVTDAPVDPTRKLEALQCIQRMLFEIMGGELMDVDMAITGRPSSPERLLAICQYKTASYSFQTPLRLGAILAGASDSTQEQLHHFGHSLGIAFQLADDLLGVYGDEAKLGKPVTSDLREGKQTLLIYYAFELVSPAQAKLLHKHWGNRRAGLPELEQVRDILHDCGAQAKTAALADNHLQDALVILEAIPLSSPVKSELTRLARYSVNREH